MLVVRAWLHFCAVFFGWLALSGSAVAGEFVVHEGLAFSKAAPELTLDLYEVKAEKPVPCVTVIQGGGFLPQDGRRVKAFAEHLARQGFDGADVPQMKLGQSGVLGWTTWLGERTTTADADEVIIRPNVAQLTTDGPATRPAHDD